MNILFDLNHPKDVNCFKNSIRTLSKRGHHIIVTYRPRGKLQAIVHSELSEFSPVKIGRHYSSFIMKILGQLMRDFAFIPFHRKNKIHLSVGTSTNAMSSWLLRIPHLALEDDIEYKIPFYHANLFATRHIMPSYIKIRRKNVYHYKGLEELAYLHPAHFSPREEELIKYQVEPGDYVFIREVAGVSLNYKKRNSLNLDVVKKLRKLGLKILLSLEDAGMKEHFEDHCTILQEPVDDIFSLMKYALFTISSGDTMARESCLLGTPAIYTGGREMLLNKELIEMGCMFKEESLNDITDRIEYLSQNDVKERTGKLIRHKIEHDWDDPTQVILKHIKDFEV
jgi:hypothetical protein